MPRHALHTAKDIVTASELARYADSPLDILLVEDDASDRMLIEMSLDDAHVKYAMHALKDGQAVLPYLHRKGKYCDEGIPDIMFLDLSLPTKDGFEVLADLAEHSAYFSDLPIVILTGDTRCAFLTHSYGLKVAAYITKPCTPEKISAALAAIQRH